MAENSIGPGTVLAGRFRLEDLVQETAGAKFWRATDRTLARSVAVNVVDATDPRAQALLQAARTSATVTDGHFLRVLDAAEEDGFVYVVNEWGSGISLDKMLGDGPLPPRRAAWLVKEVAEAIATAHRHGIAHGRLLPENVMVTEAGSVKLIGFVVDAVLNVRARPQAGGAPLSEHESDVVNLASLLYATLVGRWPGTEGSSLPDAPREHDRALRPRQVRAGVPRPLDAICDRVLNAEANQHTMPIETAHEIAAALSDFIGDPTGAQVGYEATSVIDRDELTAGTTVDDGLEATSLWNTATGAARRRPLCARCARVRVRCRQHGRGAQGAHAGRRTGPRGHPGGSAAVLRRRHRRRLGLPHQEPRPAQRRGPGVPGRAATTPAVARARAEATLRTRPPGRAHPAGPGAAGPRAKRPRATGPRAARPALQDPAPRRTLQPDSRPGDRVAARRSGAPTPTGRTTPKPPAAGRPGTPARAGCSSPRSWPAACCSCSRPSSRSTSAATPSSRGPPRTTTSPPGRPRTSPPDRSRSPEVDDFDPQGDAPQDENPELVDLAVDGDPSTAWQTLTYQGNPKLGLLKDGVGLVVDLGKPVDVSSVNLTLIGRPTSLEILAADEGAGAPTSADGLNRVASANGAGPKLDLQLDDPVSTRYLVVWLTSLPPFSDGYKGQVAEIVVRS